MVVPPAQRSRTPRLLPQGWGDLAEQVALFGASYLLYQLVRGAVARNPLDPGYAPFGNARTVIYMERAAHLFVEPAIQAWTQRIRPLMDMADWTYLNAQYLVAGGALLFIYLRHNDSYYLLRNTFLIAIGIALIGYALFPTAPPRLMPEWGFTDSIREFTGVTVERGASGSLLNLYAAVPSMHVCFALLVGIPMARLARHRPVRILWGLYPLWIGFVVIATANHYLFDVVLGALTAGASALIACRVPAKGHRLQRAVHT